MTGPIGAPAIATESLRITRLAVFRPIASMSGPSGIDGHGLLCVETIAVTEPVDMASSADLGVAFSLRDEARSTDRWRELIEHDTRIIRVAMRS